MYLFLYFLRVCYRVLFLCPGVLASSDTVFHDLKNVVWSASDENGVVDAWRPDFVLMAKMCRALMLVAIEYKKQAATEAEADTDRCVRCLARGRLVLGWYLAAAFLLLCRAFAFVGFAL